MDAAKCAKITLMFAIATTSCTAASGAQPEKQAELAIQGNLSSKEDEERDPGQISCCSQNVIMQSEKHWNNIIIFHETVK